MNRFISFIPHIRIYDNNIKTIRVLFISKQYTKLSSTKRVRQSNVTMSYHTLSLEQKYAFSKFKKGENIFVTGPGGTGKTRLIQHLVYHMKQSGICYQVCALTGCAAVLLNCGAKTIHSWSGIKMGKGTPDQIIGRITRNRNVVKAWRDIKVLVVDEVSMLSCKMFEVLDEVGRVVRRNTKPFGGIQLVFTGDFFQLPPIPEAGDPRSAAFCFESPRWVPTFPANACVELTTFFRQTDPVYIGILQEIRKGYIEPENADLLRKHVKRPYNAEENGGCVPTKLFPVRAKVDAVNNIMFAKLEGPEHVYEYTYSTKNLTYVESGKLISTEDKRRCEQLTKLEMEAELDALLSNIQTAKTFALKKGAVVMCTTNLCVEEGICNGSQGVIVDFVESPVRDLSSNTSMLVPLVRFTNGKTMRIAPFQRQSDEYPCLTVSQIPLCLAWALTIHKIQGATLQIADIDIGKTIFEYGQTYVALSRIQTLDGLYLSEFYPHRIKANPTVIAFYESFPKVSPEQMNAAAAEPDAASMAEASKTILQRAIEMETSNIKVIRI